MIIWLHFK